MRESVAERLNRRRLLTVGGSAAAAALAVDAAGPSTSTSWAADPQLGIINLKVDHGAVGDGTTSDLDAINAAIADLNDGEYQALYVPPGQYKMNALADPIIQSNVAIFGAGGSVSEFLHTDGTEGSFFQVGDQASGVAADGVVIASLGLHCDNDPTSRRQALLAPNCEDLRVFGVHVQGIAGLCKLGAVATIDAEATRCQRPSFSHVWGSQRSDLIDKSIEIVNAGALQFAHVHVNGDGTEPNGPQYMIYARPTEQDLDEAHFVDVVMRGRSPPAPLFSNIVYFDFSVQTIQNVWFDGCVLDESGVAGVAINSDPGSSATNELRHIHFVDCRVSTNAGDAVVVTHNGAGRVSDLIFSRCVLVYKAPNGSTNPRAVTVTGEDRFNHLVFESCDIQDSAAHSKDSAMQFGVGGFMVRGCNFHRGDPTTGDTDYGVTLTADVDGFIIAENKFDDLNKAIVLHYPYAADSADRLVRANVGQRRVFKITGDGSKTAFTVTHDFGSRHLLAQVYRYSGTRDTVGPPSVGAPTGVSIEHTTFNTVTVRFATAPSAGTKYRLVLG